jgi:hypothetical protein
MGCVDFARHDVVMYIAHGFVTEWDLDGRSPRMSITAVPTRHSPPAMLWRASCRDGAKVRTRTRAQLTSWAPERIDARRRALQGEVDGVTAEPHPICGPLCAVLLALKQLAERLGLLQVLGSERWATLVRLLIVARVAAQGSRRSAVRWATQHAVAETLGLQPCDADDLYAARDRLAEAQEDLEDARARRTVRPRGGTPTVVVDDVTASDLAGEHQALAALGDSRDRKPGQAHIGIGRLTTAAGAPVAVPVYEGHTADPVTVPAHVHTRRTRLGSTALVCVGDRGRVQATGQPALSTAGVRSITARTTPPVRRLLPRQVLRPAWVTTHGPAVVHGAGRWIRRRRAALRQHAARRRADTWATLPRLITARHTFVSAATRAQPATGRRTLQAWVTRHKRAGLVPVARQAGRLLATRDPAAQAEATVLDGCDVLATDVPQATLEAHAVPDRDRDLHAVEQDCRTMTTGLLEVRPLVVRNARRTRAPVLVTLLAVQVGRAMRRARVAAFGTTEDDTMAVTVEAALLAFARLCLLTSHVQGTAVTRVPTPEARHKAMLDALGTPLPPPRSWRHM